MTDVDIEEYRRLIRNQQEHGTTQARLQAELEAHLRDSAKTTADFYEFVMNPSEGVVVRASSLEDRMGSVENHIRMARMDASKVGPLEARVLKMETDRATEASDRKETRRWGVRDVIVPFLMGLLGAAILWALSGRT